MNYALTVYPLSSAFRGRLAEALADDPVYLNLSELRRLPLRQMFTRLRSLAGARLVLPLEDDNSTSILPLLLAVAAVANASVIEIRYPDLRAQRLSRWDLIRSLQALAGASVYAAVDAARCNRELASLLAAPRIATGLSPTPQALYLNANLWFGVKAGGSIGHVAGVVNAMYRSGQDVTYASAGGRTMIDDQVSSIALTSPAIFGLPYELNYYRFHRIVVRQLRSRQAPRFIYQRMSVANYAGVELARHWRVPLVLEYNGSEAWIASNWGRPLRYHNLAVKAEQACLRHADVVVTISDVLRDELISKGVGPERIVSYPNCIDPEVFDPARFSQVEVDGLRQRLGIPLDAVLATFVGTFGQWHGAEVLARAIRELVQQHRDWVYKAKLHFLLVGDGLKMSSVRQILSESGCDRFVTLPGLIPQAEAPACLAASDILLSPHVGNGDGTRFFGSPTKLFEYMAMGRTIVASDLDQIGMVLRDSLRSESLPREPPAAGVSQLGILVPPGDVGALVKSIRFATERADWRVALGRNARAAALVKYTWKHHVAAIIERLDAVVG